LAGLALYVLAGIAATFATSGPMLLVARLMQGLGASAGLALPRAIARDRYTGATFLRVMSSLTLAMAVMPGIAPVLGGLVAGHSGWRASLALSALTGVAVLVAVVLALPESHLNRVRGSGMAAALAGYAHVMRRRVFLGYAFASGAAVGGAYAEVAGVQRLYEGTFGWSPMAVSFVSGTYAFAFLVGGLLAPRLRLSHHRNIQLGVGLIVASALIFLGLTASGTITAPLAMAAMMLSQIGVGCMMPPAIGLGLMAVEGAAGTASAVMGAIHMLAGATGAALIGALAMPIVWAMPLIMLGFALIAVLATLAAQPRQRDGRRALA
jgi:DHA1 family bicyclomycin/chloramphenicol resistance-like MFS transporter